MPQNKILALLTGGLTALILTGCGDKADPPPTSFQVGPDQAPALVLEDAGVLAEATQPEDGEEGAYTYTYEELPSAGAAAEQYAALLAQEEYGFISLEEEAEAPDFTQPGSLTMVKASSQEGHLFQIQLTWSEERCQVSVSAPVGELPTPPAPMEPITMSDAVEFLKSQPPSRLGLDASTAMSDYIIYPRLGAVLVDGEACLELDLYQLSPENTHNIVACYLVSGDQRSLFRLDRTTGQVEEL